MGLLYRYTHNEYISYSLNQKKKYIKKKQFELIYLSFTDCLEIMTLIGL